jgi:hypothetical protein
VSTWLAILGKCWLLKDAPRAYPGGHFPAWLGIGCVHGLPMLAQDRNNIKKCFNINGERGGTRTHDPMIKSHVLYHLSYALTCRAV